VPKAGDRGRGPAREVGTVVDQSLVDSIHAVVFAVPGVDDFGVELDRVLRREVGEHHAVQRLLMKIHGVVVAAAIVASKTHTPATFDANGPPTSMTTRRFCWLSASTSNAVENFVNVGSLVLTSIAPPTPCPGPACTLAGPL
jgi:hypothetical protein